MGDEVDALLSSSASSSDDDGSEEDAMEELVRSMETMLAQSAPRARPTTPRAAAVRAALTGSSTSAAAGVARSHSNPRDWREEWRCSSRLSLQSDGEGCKRSCMPVAEAQRSRVVGIPGLLDASEIEQIHALAALCADADPFWDT